MLSVFFFWLYKSNKDHYQFLGDRPGHMWPDEDKADAKQMGIEPFLEMYRRSVIRMRWAAWLMGAASVAGFGWFTWLRVTG